jgi:hypothetical protein
MTDPKCELGEVEKAMFHVIERLWNLISCLLVISKFDLVEIGKMMLLGVDRTWVLIFCLIVVSKCYLARSKEWCYNVSTCAGNLYSVFCPAQMRMCWSREGNISIGKLNYSTNFLPSCWPKCDLVEVE